MTAADVVLTDSTPSLETHADPQAEPAETALPGRNPRGQFAPGNPGGPGRPPKVAHIERELVAFMASAISVDLWMQIAHTAAQQAAEGNHTARAWLSKTFLSGRLTETAAADAIGLPTEIEMGEVGRLKHPRWVDFLHRQRAGREAELEAEPTDENGAEPADAPRVQSPPAPTAPLASASAPAAPAAPATPARTIPVADRVNGFRVTKGPREPLNNGRKRQNAVKTAPTAAPCSV